MKWSFQIRAKIYTGFELKESRSLRVIVSRIGNRRYAEALKREMLASGCKIMFLYGKHALKCHRQVLIHNSFHTRYLDNRRARHVQRKHARRVSIFLPPKSVL